LPRATGDAAAAGAHRHGRETCGQLNFTKDEEALDMTDLFAPEAVSAFFQVIIIDLSLAGDNAIVVGMAAAGLPPQQRARAILFGMMGATVLLVLLAGITTQLLKIVGLLFAGGVLLLWVSWKMWRELRWSGHEELEAVEALTSLDSMSIVTMGIAASLIARLLQKYRWIAYVGLAVILYVALGMVYRGALELRPIVSAAAGLS
jgi:predicted tellurium resistance membrane protein TerC